MKSWNRVVLMLAVLALPVACSVFSSKHISARQSPRAERPDGIVYFLPKGLLRIDMVRTNLTQETIYKRLVLTNEIISTAYSNASGWVYSQSTNDYFIVTNATDNASIISNSVAASRSVNSNEFLVAISNTTVTVTNVMETITKTNGPPTYHIDVSVKLVRDPKQMYLLKYNPSADSSDQFSVTVNEDGFLSSLSSSNADESVAIAKKLIDTAALVVRAAAGGAVPANKKDINKEDDLLPRVTIEFDPTDLGAWASVTNLIYKRTNVRMSIQWSPWSPSDRVPSPQARDEAHGLVYRPLLPYTFRFESGPQLEGTKRARKKHRLLVDTNDVAQSTLDSFISDGLRDVTVLLPNAAPILRYDVRRAAGVTVANQLTFRDGVPVVVSVSKPSEALAFAELPLHAANAVLGTITNLVQLKFDIKTQAEAAKSNQTAQAQQTLAAQRQAELDEIEYQKDLEEKKKELATAQAGRIQAERELANTKTGAPPPAAQSP